MGMIADLAPVAAPVAAVVAYSIGHFVGSRSASWRIASLQRRLDDVDAIWRAELARVKAAKSGEPE